MKDGLWARGPSYNFILIPAPNCASLLFHFQFKALINVVCSIIKFHSFIIIKFHSFNIYSTINVVWLSNKLLPVLSPLLYNTSIFIPIFKHNPRDKEAAIFKQNQSGELKLRRRHTATSLNRCQF